ncbi:hypothetical protein [Vibrio vulnificus]|uniref:hypothetical protein n=1 Tax=Vibrio vulnificus TaxID=672 RepID=UPI001CDC7A3B|nr:hypothetical protein [Vibrio vulnificus]MCA3950716.1 hypothetical protein [Vibrio vulnificus]
MNWRVFTFISLLSQALRVPIILSIISNVSYLDNYFVIVAISIPAQFFATEVLLYRGISASYDKGRVLDFSIIVLWMLSLVYFIIHNNCQSTIFYTIYSLSVVLYGYFNYQLRESFGAVGFLKYDALINFTITIFCVLIIEFLPDEYSSYFILSMISFLYLSFSLACFCYFKYFGICFYSKISVNQSYKGYFYQVLIMITTQLERMIIGLIWPTFLGYISIVGAGTNAWRRMTLDDSILFSQIKNGNSNMLALEFLEKYKKSALLFSTLGVILSLIGLFNSDFIFLHVNIKSDVIASLALLSLIYLTVMPFGIVSINLIRSNEFFPQGISFNYIYSSICFLVCFLIAVSMFQVEVHNLVWLIISMTALINVVIFFDFLNVKGLMSEHKSVGYLFSMLLLLLIVIYAK